MVNDNYKKKAIQFVSKFINEKSLMKIVFVILEKLVKSSSNTLDDKILKILEEQLKEK